MAGSHPPQSAWYTLERLESWMDVFSIQPSEISVVLGPRVQQTSGDFIMDVYARYEGDKGFDAHWDAEINYSSLDMEYTELIEEYELWQDKFEEELPEADLYMPEL